MPEVIVRGVGRVGRPNRLRCRARKYWALFWFNNQCSSRCKIIEGQHPRHIHYPIGYVEWEGQPRFKTQKAAEEYLKGLAEEINALTSEIQKGTS